MATNAELTNEYFETMDDLDNDVEGRRTAFDYMKGSSAIVHHQVVASTFIPKLFNSQTYKCMKQSSEMAHKILCKVMRHYLEDPQYRKVFDFDERLVDLILLPRGYDSILPFARVDTFINEDDFNMHFCEFNGDGSAGMNENREITNSILNTETFKVFAENHKLFGCDLFSAWVHKFIEIYDTYIYKVNNPHFAICDYLENGVVDEFHVYAQLFKHAGYNCDVYDVRQLTFDGHTLQGPDGVPIHAIWRRCVTNDVLEYWNESQALIEAVRAEKVALIGSFAGHIVHDKQIFEVLFKPETTAFLTAEEISFIEQTVPLTTFLNDNYVNIEQILSNKNEWIIKPTDHYGSDNVYAGIEVTQEKWEELISLFANDKAGYPFLIQRYIKPYKTMTLPPDFEIDELPDGSVGRTPQMYNNMNGLYLFDGVFMGVFSRLGPNPTISKQNEGITAATIWVDTEIEGLPSLAKNEIWRKSAGFGDLQLT